MASVASDRSRGLWLTLAASLLVAVLVAIVASAPALRLWPLVVLPFLTTRYYGRATLAAILGICTLIAISQINSGLSVISSLNELQYGESS